MTGQAALLVALRNSGGACFSMNQLAFTSRNVSKAYTSLEKELRRRHALTIHRFLQEYVVAWH